MIVRTSLQVLLQSSCLNIIYPIFILTTDMHFHAIVGLASVLLTSTMVGASPLQPRAGYDPHSNTDPVTGRPLGEHSRLQHHPPIVRADLTSCSQGAKAQLKRSQSPLAVEPAKRSWLPGAPTRWRLQLPRLKSRQISHLPRCSGQPY